MLFGEKRGRPKRNLTIHLICDADEVRQTHFEIEQVAIENNLSVEEAKRQIFDLGLCQSLIITGERYGDEDLRLSGHFGDELRKLNGGLMSEEDAQKAEKSHKNKLEEDRRLATNGTA